MIPTAGHLRLSIGGLFADSTVPDPMLEADRLMCLVMDTTRAHLHAHPEMPVDGKRYARALELAARRAAGEPFAHIAGTSIFCGREYKVDGRVLIPRPETETLVSAALAELEGIERPIVADWCTGSGCVAIAILDALPAAAAYAVDASRCALDVARENAAAHGVDGRITFIECADPGLALAIPPASLDVVTANPPYIMTDEIAGLDREVRDFEPHIALDGGRDGLDVARTLVDRLHAYMKRGALLIMETAGPSQTEQLAHHAARGDALAFTGTLPDHRGIERFASFRAR